MKLLGYIVLACVALSLLQAALSIVVVGLVIILLLSVVSHPRETFGFIGFVVLANLLQTHPIACIGIFALLAIIAAVARPGARPPAKEPARLPDPRHHQPLPPPINDE